MTIADVRQERDGLRAENNALAVELADALAEVTRLRAALATIGAMSPEMAESDAAADARDAQR